MKIRNVVIVLMALATQSVSAAQIITISKFQYGKQWAFTKEEVQLLCRPDGALLALNMSTLMQYPLNERANQAMKTGQIKAVPVDTILLDDPSRPGQKMSIEPFVARASQLCDTPKQPQ